jgi:osmotically-inducible protein OsmY
MPVDADLTQLAGLALEQRGFAPDDQVKVIARDGWLILEGEVDTPSRKHAVAAAVENLSAMRGIRNNIACANSILADRVHQQIVDDFMFDARVEAAASWCWPMTRRS